MSDPAYVRLIMFKSWWDVMNGTRWRAYGPSEDDQPWLDQPPSPKTKGRRLTKTQTGYEAHYCVNCGHLRYAGEGPGDPCWFCHCVKHVLPGEPPMEVAWAAQFELGHGGCGGWYREPTDPPGEITCACGDTLLIA